MDPTRLPAGTPTGGRFAPDPHAEATEVTVEDRFDPEHRVEARALPEWGGSVDETFSAGVAHLVAARYEMGEEREQMTTAAEVIGAEVVRRCGDDLPAEAVGDEVLSPESFSIRYGDVRADHLAATQVTIVTEAPDRDHPPWSHRVTVAHPDGRATVNFGDPDDFNDINISLTAGIPEDGATPST